MKFKPGMKFVHVDTGVIFTVEKTVKGNIYGNLTKKTGEKLTGNDGNSRMMYSRGLFSGLIKRGDFRMSAFEYFKSLIKEQ